MAALDIEGLKAKAVKAWKSFSGPQLVTIGLLTVVALVGAMFFLKWVTAPTYGVLLAGMDPKDAAAVTAKLDADGVAYQLQGGGTTVLVPTDALDAERLAVAAAGLPAGSTSGGWEAFDKAGMTSSSFQQQVAYQRAMESELSSAVEGVDGVRSAQVHLSVPEKRLFTDQQEKARASVLLESDGSLGDDAVDAISHLVASAVPGLAPGDVSITDSTGHLLSADGSTAGSDRAAKQQQAYEDVLSARVTSMFDTLLGPGKAVVRVNAEMDTSNRTIDSETYDPTKTAVLSSSESKETYATAPGGTTAGVITSTPAPSASASPNGYEKTSTQVQNGVTRTVERQVQAPGSVKRLTVAVAVDRNAPNAPSPAELQALAANAVGLDPTRGDTIAVTTPSFLQDAGTTGGTTTGTAGSTRSMSELAAKVLGGVLLLLVGLGFLRTVRKGTVVEIPAAEVTAAIESAGGRKGRKQAAELEAAAEALPALPAGSVPEPRSEEELLAALDDNPDEVAGLLRGWLSSVGGEQS